MPFGMTHYLSDLKRKGYSSVELVTDSCRGQNRNRIMFALWWVTKSYPLKVTITFFVRGLRKRVQL